MKRGFTCVLWKPSIDLSIIYQGTQIIIYHSFSLCGRNVCILCVLVRPESERNKTAYVFCQFLACVGQSALDNKSICLPKKNSFKDIDHSVFSILVEWSQLLFPQCFLPSWPVLCLKSNYCNFQPFTHTADYLHRPINAYGKKKVNRLSTLVDDPHGMLLNFLVVKMWH